MNFPKKFSNQEGFPKKFFRTQRNFPEKFFSLFQDRNQENFPQSFVEGAVQNFIAGVDFFAQKAKEVEQDARKRFCDYPSA